MSQVACRGCGTAIRDDARFCTACGRPTSTGGAPAPVARVAARVPETQPAPTVPAARRSHLWVLVTCVVLASGALAAIAYTVLRGDGASGGAASPEAAVTGLADALAADDLLAAAELVAPDEVLGVDALLTAILDRARAEQVPGLAPGEGVDVQIELGAPDVDELADDAAAVDVDVDLGLTSTTTGPLGLVLPEDVDGSIEMRLITVRVGGGWYVSPLLSMGDAIVESADLPAGDYDAVGDDDALGSGHPEAEAAVDGLLDAVADSDVDGTIGALATGEARFLRVFEDAVDELLAETPEGRLDVRGVSLEDLGDGRLLVTGGELGIDRGDGGTVDVELDDDCIETVTTWPDDRSEGRVCLVRHLELIEPLTNGGVVLRTVDEQGGHRVQLIASAADHAAELVAKLPREAFFVLLGHPELDTPTPVSIGADVPYDLGERAYQVFEFPIAAGETYSVTADGDDVAEDVFVEEDGTWREVFRLLRPDVAGSARVVLRSTDPCDDICLPTGGSGTLRVRQAGGQDVVFPATYTGELGPGDVRILTFEVPQREQILITSEGDGTVGAAVYDADGAMVGDAGFPFEAQPGRYELVVTNTSTDERGAFRFVAATAADATTFSGGGREADLSLTSTSSVDLDVIAGTYVEVSAEGRDGQDVGLEVLWPDGTSCYQDRYVESSPEVCTDQVTQTGVATVTVDALTNSDDYGSARVWVEAS